MAKSLRAEVAVSRARIPDCSSFTESKRAPPVNARQVLLPT